MNVYVDISGDLASLQNSDSSLTPESHGKCLWLRKGSGSSAPPRLPDRASHGHCLSHWRQRGARARAPRSKRTLTWGRIDHGECHIATSSMRALFCLLLVLASFTAHLVAAKAPKFGPVPDKLCLLYTSDAADEEDS